MHVTRTYTALPTNSNHREIGSFLEMLRHLYNAALQERIDAYGKQGKTISYFDQCKGLTQVRHDDPDYAKYAVNILRSPLNRLDKGYKIFFSRVKKGQKPGYPRFKGYGQITSFDTDIPNIKQRGKYHVLKLKGLPDLKFKATEVSMQQGDIKLARVVRKGKRIEVQLVFELPDTPKVPVVNPVGIDMGIKERMILSTGEMANPVKLDRRELKRKQRLLSRAKKGSNSRKKKRDLLANEWRRNTIRERNIAHRITSDIIKKHKHIAIEDLQINNMVKNHKLARSIQEQTWGLLKQMLSYKAEWAGGKVVEVNPRFTSKTCHVCGNVQDMPLSERTYSCRQCGQVTDRDVNAARNILRLGIESSGWEKDMKESCLPGASGDAFVYMSPDYRGTTQKYPLFG